MQLIQCVQYGAILIVGKYLFAQANAVLPTPKCLVLNKMRLTS